MKTSFAVQIGLACALLSASATFASAQTLYDGAGGKRPDQSPYTWIYGQSPLPIPPTPNLRGTVSGGAITVNTTGDNGFTAGYNYVAPFTLNSATGYTITFDLQVNSETHDGPAADKNGDGTADRAGVSLIALGNDNKGVELAFWNNEVWTQSNGFLHTISNGENAAFDTTSGRIHYVLNVANGSYALSGGGTALLGGSLHSYAASGPAIPYSLTNYLFIGDDTSSARGSFSLFQVQASQPQATPEPGAVAMLIGLATGSIGLRCRARWSNG